MYTSFPIKLLLDSNLDAAAIGHSVLMLAFTSNPICVRIRPAVLESGSVSILSSLLSLSFFRAVRSARLFLLSARPLYCPRMPSAASSRRRTSVYTSSAIDLIISSKAFSSFVFPVSTSSCSSSSWSAFCHEFLWPLRRCPSRATFIPVSF